MAYPDQLALLKKSVKEWNEWRKANPNVKVNLSYANLSYADLSTVDFHLADLSYANLASTNLSYADLRGANLDYANLSKANLTGADLVRFPLIKENSRGFALFQITHLQGTILKGAILKRTILDGTDGTEASISEAIRKDAGLIGAWGNPPSKSATSEPHPSQSSSTVDWLSLVETVGSNLLVTAATLASIIQGLDVVERRWREHQEKHKQQGTQTSLPASASSPQPAASPSKRIPASDKEIVEILLVMDDGSQHEFKRWISEPNALKAYIDVFSDPTSKVKPLQVVFRKLGGRALVVDVTKEGKDNKQFNAILGYLDADPL